jgi:hypothetical protein
LKLGDFEIVILELIFRAHGRNRKFSESPNIIRHMNGNARTATLQGGQNITIHPISGSGQDLDDPLV